MTKIALSPNASGTGTFTIQSPNSDTDRTLTLPDAAGEVVTKDGSGTINAQNISDGTTTVGTEYVVNGSAKAWVNFDGTGTVAIREDLNVGSITDNGTGDYTFSMVSAFTNANWSAAGCTGGTGGSSSNGGTVVCFDSATDRPRSSTQCSVDTFLPTVGSTDRPQVNVSIQGKLA